MDSVQPPIALPSDALYGAHTIRACRNFPFSGPKISLDLVKALAEIKRAAAQVNGSLSYLLPEVVFAVMQACDEIIAGEHAEQFVVPALQGGAGTSTNMNVNEVIAHRAQQILGGDVLDPIEVVNLHQSTNDVYPTAVRMVAIRLLRQLANTVTGLQGSFQSKERAWQDIITLGRTELQDAVPMTLGLQFGSFAQAIERDRWRCFKAEERIRVVNLGGTAIGTGLTAPRDYIFQVIEQLRSNTGLPLARAEHLVDATANQDAFVEVHAILLAHATNLIKICQDLRFLHYQREIALPALQAGSTIMPGKVNPVICEVVISAALRVKANNALIADAVQMGTLQINEYMPLIAHSLFDSLTLLHEASLALTSYVEATKPGVEACGKHEENSEMLITAFLPIIGYAQAEQLLTQYRALAEPQPFRQFLEHQLGEELVERTLKPAQLVSLGYRKEKTRP